MNDLGPRTEPGGTQQLTVVLPDDWPLTCMIWVLADSMTKTTLQLYRWLQSVFGRHQEVLDDRVCWRQTKNRVRQWHPHHLCRYYKQDHSGSCQYFRYADWTRENRPHLFAWFCDTGVNDVLKYVWNKTEVRNWTIKVKVWWL